MTDEQTPARFISQPTFRERSWVWFMARGQWAPVTPRMRREDARPAELAALVDQARQFAGERLGAEDAVKVIEGVLGWLLPIVPQDGTLPRLKRILETVEEPRHRERRGLCMALIHEAAAKGWPPEYLAGTLIAQDRAFECVRDDLPGLAARLANWAPKRQSGKQTSANILASIIVEDCDADGALGYAAKPDELTEEAIKRIAKQLTSNDVTYRRSRSNVPASDGGGHSSE